MSDNRNEIEKHIEYYSNGKKKLEGHYKDGKHDGLWTHWHENGQKKRQSHYKNDKLISRKEF